MEISHRKGVSYLTGKIASVPSEALCDYIDEWPDFSSFMAGKIPAKRGCGLLFVAIILFTLLLLCGLSILTEPH